MAKTLERVIFNTGIESLVEQYGKPYTEQSDHMRRGRSEQWPARRLKHEVNGRRTPLDLSASVEAAQKQGFDIETLPFEPTFVRFIGKIADRRPTDRIVTWRLFAQDMRFGIMCNYEGGDRHLIPSTMVESREDPYRFSDELASAPYLHGGNLAVAAVLIDHVAINLAQTRG